MIPLIDAESVNSGTIKTLSRVSVGRRRAIYFISDRPGSVGMAVAEVDAYDQAARIYGVTWCSSEEILDVAAACCQAHEASTSWH